MWHLYGLPATFDASVFVGRELEAVSFYAYSIHLSFDHEVAITIEASFVYQAGVGAPAEKKTCPVSSSNLMQLVGRVVRSAEGRRDGTLTLVFDEGHVLTCLDDSSQYESYQLHINGEQITV